MRTVCLCALLCFALTLVFAGAACAVKIDKNNYSSLGWVITGNRGSDPDALHKVQMRFQEGPPMPPLGYGSFWEKTYEYYFTNGSGVPKVYLGNDFLSGIEIGRISTLRYSTFLRSRAYHGQALAGVPHGQPPMLEITTDSGGTTQQRFFMFLPFGLDGRPGDPDPATGYWEEWDALASTGYWEMANTTSANFHGNWSWVTTRYPNPKFQTPPVADYSAGVITGCSFNIKVGAGQKSNKDPVGSQHDAWWKQSCAVDGYADKLIIGLDSDTTMYEFDFDVTGAVATCNRSTRDPIMTDVVDPNQANAKLGPRHDYAFVLFGRVLNDADFGPYTFNIDDGSGLPVKVIVSEGHMVGTDQYVRAKGILNNTVSPPVLYCRAVDCWPFVEP